MRIAITATGRDLDSSLDPCFGRCPCFLLVDPEIQEYQAVPNPESPGRRCRHQGGNGYIRRHIRAGMRAGGDCYTKEEETVLGRVPSGGKLLQAGGDTVAGVDGSEFNG